MDELVWLLLLFQAQLGLLILGYLCYRKIAALRARMAVLEASSVSSARHQDALHLGLRERVQAMERPLSRTRTMLKAGQDPRRQTAKAGGSADQHVELLNMAHAMNLRWAEVDLLVRVHQMRKAQAKTWELAALPEAGQSSATGKTLEIPAAPATAEVGPAGNQSSSAAAGQM